MGFKALVKKRGSIKARLTRFVQYLDVIQTYPQLSSLLLNELTFRLTKIEELYSDFDCIQSDIENVCEIPEEQYNGRENFETQYFGAVASGRDVLSRQDTSAGNRSAAGSGTDSGRKVPTTKLPTTRTSTFIESINHQLSCVSEVQNASQISTFSRYTRMQQLKAHFWDRFYKEYISELQRRQKWRTKEDDLKVGEMVLVKDDRLPPNQ